MKLPKYLFVQLILVHIRTISMHLQKAILIHVSIVFFLFSGVANAIDQVSPSDRVTSHLNVRQDSTKDSPVVGSLQPDQSAIHIESVPYWYLVELQNGVQGYVSKAWSELTNSHVEAIEHIRIGHWNIKKLGHGSSTNFPLVAKLIDDNFDIIALVEVMQKKGGHQGYDTLLEQLCEEWAGIVTSSPRPNTGAGHAEFYAVAYRKEFERTCAGWDQLIYHPDNDGGSDGTGNDYFSREPAYGCFEAGIDGRVSVDFMLAAYHARWADGKTAEIRDEVDHLGEVFESMRNSKPGEMDLFISGDFNLVPDALREAGNFNVVTDGSGSTLNSKGQRTANLYDHFLVYDAVSSSEIVGNPTVLDLTGVTVTGKTFYKTVSDHLPVVASLQVNGEDDD